MASLIFAHAKSIRNKAKKFAAQMAQGQEQLGLDYKEAYEKAYDNFNRGEENEFREVLRIAKRLHAIYQEETGLETENWYFITVRPDTKQITFPQFKQKIEKYLTRKPFLEFTYSYEQKGQSDDTLGEGFHCHIVAKTNWRSKGEVLRDTQSSFKSCTAPNCIDVATTKNPQDIVNKYLVGYEAKDSHKACTKEYDAKWRDINDLLPLYHSKPLITEEAEEDDNK